MKLYCYVLGDISPESVATLTEQIGHLQTQLEESRRWNASLQLRLGQQQPIKHRGGGVGGAKDTTITHNATEAQEPSYLHDSLGFNNDSLIPSFRELPGIDEVVPDNDMLAEMNVDQLQEVVQTLKAELMKAHSQNSQLIHYSSLLDHTRDIPGENAKDVLGVRLRTEMDHLREDLQSTYKEKADLQKQLDSILNSPQSNADVRLIPVLKQHLNDAKNSLAKKQHEIDELNRQFQGDHVGTIDSQDQVAKLKAQLSHTQNLNDLLKKQIELDSRLHGHEAGFNPELIVQMAQEIERLKEELERSRGKLTKSDSVLDVKGKSKIPVANGKNGSASCQAQLVLQKQMESNRAEMNDAKVKSTTFTSFISDKAY